MYFFITSFTPDVHVAKPLCLTWLLLCVLSSGYVVPREQIPVFYKWLYWLNPNAWGIRSLAISQYRSDKFDVAVDRGVDFVGTHNQTMGVFLLSFYDIQSERSWIVYGLAYSAAFYVLFMLFTCLVLERKRLEAPENVVVRKDSLDNSTFV
ncbi:hypothetical protein P43SY_010429 [Pythium insidiosum]|uniref:ABC-2 type transporter transmembrane domain-containing protein n=1 Tax=Pythium insidiosum TaxID=114742 RepID=A0AAD5L5R5_PYTIN|nr:hypothetical protein P43SY_010429 [Pythium insidiosum]